MSHLVTLLTPIKRYALTFDGVNDSVSVAHNAVFNMTTAVTIEFWIKRNGTTATYETIISKRDGVSCNYEVYLDTSTKKIGLFNGGSVVLSTIVPAIGVWSHIAVATNATTSTFYLNGALAGTTGVGIGATNTAVVSMGVFSGQWLWATLDDARIWNVARTQTEIQANMNKQLIGNETGLVGYWKFNEGTGLTASDSTANGNNGTLTGGPAWAYGIV